jgi:signal transduction histidine kinase
MVTPSADLPDLPPVMAGREGLSLALLNLLDNAGEAFAAAPSGEAGEICVTGTSRGEWVEVAVADNGPGIPTEMHARIFEFDVSGRRRGAKDGRLGFGLWWVKTLITRLGGTIVVESDGRRGTTFRLQLPAAAAAARS